MTSEEFIDAVHQHIRDQAIDDTISSLRSPPGRRPPPEVRARSEWYLGLSEEEKAHVRAIVGSAVHAALFGLFAAFDGERTINDSGGRFELLHVEEQKTLINPDSISLHDMLEPAK